MQILLRNKTGLLRFCKNLCRFLSQLDILVGGNEWPAYFPVSQWTTKKPVRSEETDKKIMQILLQNKKGYVDSAKTYVDFSTGHFQ
jgi:hypothetical protein